MTEFEEFQGKARPVIIVLWVALITAIIITIFDWKIKQDILRITQEFHNRLEGQNVRQTPSTGYSNNPSLSGVPVVHTNPRMEKANASTSSPQNSEDHSAAWSEYAPGISTGLVDTGTSENNGRFPQESFGVPVDE